MSGPNDDPTGKKLAERAVARGLITADQHFQALAMQQKLGGFHHLGAILVSNGYIDEKDLAGLLKDPGPAAPAPAPSPAPVKPAPAVKAAPAPKPAAPPPAPPKAAAPGRIELDDELASFLRSVGVAGETAPPPRPAAERPFVERTKVGPDTGRAAGRPPLSGLDRHLAQAAARGASDLHVHPGQPLQHRVNGELAPADGHTLDAAATEALLSPAIPANLREHFATVRDVDFTYVGADGQRARANIYRGQRGLSGVFRLVPKRIPSLTELGLPETIAKFTHYHSGLLLVTGPSGSGKTTTLNSIIDLINQERDDHILTIEDPIEYVHESKRCLVNQRQVMRDTKSFSRALKGALREDPDIIVIGELRDYETISLAITAAETGHLVLGSLHTAYATRTIMRMLDVFPAGERGQVRSMLSESLRAIVAQKLLPGVDGKMHVAPEILVMTPAIANLIRDDKMHQMQGAMQMSKQQGSRLMNDSIKELVAKKVVAPEVAQTFMIGGGQAQEEKSAAPAR